MIMMLMRVTVTALVLAILPEMVNALACFPNNCENGSTCQDNLHWYICTCPVGFRGRHCEEIITGPIPVDTEPPRVMGCPANIEKTITSTFDRAEWTAPTAVDENNVHLVLQTHFSNQNFFQIGTTEVAYIFADDFANIANCSFTITLLTAPGEDLPPTVEFCPTNIFREVPVGTSDIPVFWNEPNVTDDGGVVTIIKQTVLSGSTFFVNTQTTVLYEFSDNAGNLASCTFTVTVTEEVAPESIPPTIHNCPSDIILHPDPTTGEAVAIWDLPVAEDNQGPVFLISQPPSPGISVPSGSNRSVEYIYSDLDRNQAVCAFTIIVRDVVAPESIPPTIRNCPSDIILHPDPTTGEAVAIWDPPVAEDNQGPVFLISQPPSPGISVSSGSNRSVEYIYSDLDHNQAVCAFNIIVRNLDLSITCPDDIRQSTDGQTDTVVVTWEEPTLPTAGDYRVAGTHISGTLFSIGITNVSYSLVDPEGNRAADCSFQIEILGYEAPSLVCPADITVFLRPPEETTEVTWEAPKAATGQFLISSSNSGFYSVGVYEINYFLYDSTGLLAECSFLVEVGVEDVAPPMLNGCPTEAITDTVGPGESNTSVDWVEPTPAEYHIDVQVFSNHMPGDVFPIGRSSVFYTVVDENGNTGHCSFVVEVLPFVDSVPPEVSDCPSSITIQVFIGRPDPAVEWKVPTASDDHGDVRLIHVSNQPGDTFPRGISIVTYIFEDQYNNSALCSFSISVNEIQEPFLFRCPFVVNVNVEVGMRGSEVTWDEPFVTTSLNHQNLTRSHAPGSFFPVGTSTVTYSFTFPGISGYSLNCTFFVNVIAVDDVPPSVLYCPGDITKLVNDLDETPTIRWNEPVVEDNSGNFSVADQSHVSGTTFTIGETEVVFIFKDESENVAECRFQVSIQNIAAAVILPVTFAIEEVYTDDLSVTTSDAYTTFVQSLTNELDDVITSRRETRNSFGGFSIVQLRPGSIIAEVEIWFTTKPPVANITSFFNNILTGNIKSGFGHLGQLLIISTNVGLPELPQPTTSVPQTEPISSDVTYLPPTITSEPKDVSVSSVPSQTVDRETTISLLFVVIMAPVGASILILIFSLLIWACQICGEGKARSKEKSSSVTGSDHPLEMVEETAHSSGVSSSISVSSPPSSLGNGSEMKRDRYINVNEDYDITAEHGLDEAEEAETLHGIVVNESHVV